MNMKVKLQKKHIIILVAAFVILIQIGRAHV